MWVAPWGFVIGFLEAAPPQDVESGARKKSHATSEADTAWALTTKKARARLGISQSYNPWTDRRPAPALRNVPDSMRVRELVNIAWASRPRPERHLPFFVDVSQDVSRKPWSSHPPCLTRSSVIYSFEADDVVSARGKLALQGFLVRELRGLELLLDSDKSDMAGEAMCLPNLATVLVALWLSPAASWWARSP